MQLLSLKTTPQLSLTEEQMDASCKDEQQLTDSTMPPKNCPCLSVTDPRGATLLPLVEDLLHIQLVNMEKVLVFLKNCG